MRKSNKRYEKNTIRKLNTIINKFKNMDKKVTSELVLGK